MKIAAKNPTTIDQLLWSIDEERIISYLGRISYNYDEKYYLEGSFRRDGSTRFEKSVRWGRIMPFVGPRFLKTGAQSVGRMAGLCAVLHHMWGGELLSACGHGKDLQ